jgi:VWFA-related protein
MFSILLLAASAAAQEQEPVFHAGVTLVRVDVQVSGRDGRNITGLEAGDFELLDENQPQKVVYFGRESEPLDLLLLLDVSGSMRRSLEQMAAAARSSLAQLNSGDRVAVMLFARNTAIREELTTDVSKIEQEIRNAVRDQTLGSGTVINGSLIAAAEYLHKQAPRGRRAVLILTDNQSLNYQVPDEDVIKALWGADAVLNAIVVGKLRHPEAPRHDRPLNPDFTPSDVWKLADETGGEAIEAGKIGDQFRQMIERIRARYSLHYTPPEAPAGALRRIRVELSPEARNRYPGARIKSRRGYYVR